MRCGDAELLCLVDVAPMVRRQIERSRIRELHQPFGTIAERRWCTPCRQRDTSGSVTVYRDFRDAMLLAEFQNPIPEIAIRRYFRGGRNLERAIDRVPAHVSDCSGGFRPCIRRREQYDSRAARAPCGNVARAAERIRRGAGLDVRKFAVRWVDNDAEAHALLTSRSAWPASIRNFAAQFRNSYVPYPPSTGNDPLTPPFTPEGPSRWTVRRA